MDSISFIDELPYAQVKNEVIDDVEHFDKFEKWVWVVLYRHAFASAAFPSQKTIAAKVGISDRKVRECLASLEKKGWLERQGVHEGYGTVMWVVKIPQDVQIEWMEKELNRKKGKQVTKSQAAEKPAPITEKPEPVDNLPYEHIIEHLNNRAGKSFRHNAETNKKGIRARFSEGYTLENMLYVIDVKADEWLGTDNEQYLNPETLFRPSKFEKYLNQPRKQPKQPTFKQPKQTGGGMTEAERDAMLSTLDI